MGMTAEAVDGNDLRAVRAVAGRCIEGVRSGAGPALIEARTYRHLGHSKSDPATYRPKEELERWLERDPLEVGKQRLKDIGASDADIEAVDQEIHAEMERAVEAALAAPYPDPETENATEFKA
jgi:pyruvate dehydrogenase E1 component alpha subunit